MKALALAVALSSLASFPAMAHLYFGPDSVSSMTTAAPFATAYNCNVSINQDCLLSVSMVALSSMVIFKEEIKHIEVDAYDFLAGEPMTEALASVVEKAREEVKTLEHNTDEEVIVIMLRSIQ